MNNFNRKIFLRGTFFLMLFIILSLIGVWAELEGTLGGNLFWVFFSKLFYVFRFPSYTLFWDILPISATKSATVLFLGLTLNCVFYGLVIERIFYFLKTRRKRTAHCL